VQGDTPPGSYLYVRSLSCDVFLTLSVCSVLL
jgi:hypothetical protein